MNTAAPLPPLVLLNGPPGIGKSTLADVLASRHDHLTALDVDVVKHDLDSWPTDPQAAGLRAREVVLEQARPRLAAGQGVVIGQYLARPAFPDQLARLAEQVPADFVHVVLEVPADVLGGRLRERRRAPTRAEQAINDADVDPSEAAQLIASVDALAVGLEGVARVDASGTVAETLALLEQALRLD